MWIRKCCILINDDPGSQAVFTKALNDVSPETLCLTVSSTVDAINMMTVEKVIPSFIFVELNMPGMNGVEFLQTIKQIDYLKEVPVIVHALTTQSHNITELKESGALAIYLRPYEYYSTCNMLNLYFGSEMLAIQQN